MQLEQLAPKQRRVLALAILIIIMGTGYALLVIPLRAVSASYDQQLQQLTQRLAGMHNLLNEGRSARAQLQRLAVAEKRHGYYLESNRPTLAAAELQRRVKQTVENEGGSIVSSQILGEQEGSGLHRVVLRINLRMDLPTFEKILYELESKAPVLVLNNISISARPSGSTARRRGGVEQQVLDVSLDVMGFRKPVSENDE